MTERLLKENREFKEENEHLKQKNKTSQTSKKIYEVWFEPFNRAIKTFTSKDNAIAERDRLNAQNHWGNRYFIKEVVLDD